MKIHLQPLLILLLVLSLFSCQKGLGTENSEATSLPNFSNVEINDVFSRKDGKMQDRDSVVEIINQYYETIWEQGDLWGGVLIAKGDKVLFEKYRGFSQDNAQSPVDKTTALHIASVSKPITAMAVLKLVEAGQVKLDDELTQFFPKFPYEGITVKMLLNQRSGLPKYEHFIDKIQPQPSELSKKFLTNQDVLNLLIQYKPEAARAPDTGFMYCNTNYALLALIVEKVTATPFPEAMQQMVFKPLKMKHTYVFQEKDIPTAARSFYQKGAKVHPYDQLDLIYGDKNVYTTPRDLFNFSRAMFADNFLPKDLMAMVFQPYSNEKPGINNYGLGFRMKIFDDHSKLTYHNGWWHGSNSVFGHLLDSKVTIIAIGNKYSQRVYSTLALSSLFENFPYEAEKLYKVMTPNATNGEGYEE